MIVHELFPTVVGEYKLERDFTNEEKETFYSVNEMKRNLGNLTSIEKNALDLPGLEEIKSFISTKVDEYINFVYKPKYNIQSYITQSWINYTDHLQWHHRHHHENSFLSGVFYISAIKDVDKIKFYGNHYNQLSIFTETYDRLNSQSWNIGVQSRDLLIFPSSLSHTVEPSEKKGPRVSLSFNTFLRGSLGCAEQMTELILS